MKERINRIVKDLEDTEFGTDIGDDLSYCLSRELTGHKGSYVVIAGVFNYWTFRKSTEFARRLSKEFGTEVMHMCWDEQNDNVQCQIYLDGHPFLMGIHYLR